MAMTTPPEIPPTIKDGSASTNEITVYLKKLNKYLVKLHEAVAGLELRK
jgi:hypothetical protein